MGVQVSNQSFMLKSFQDFFKMGRIINDQIGYYNKNVETSKEKGCSKLQVFQKEYEANIEKTMKRLNNIKKLIEKRANDGENSSAENENGSCTDFSMKQEPNSTDLFHTADFTTYANNGLNFSFNELDETIEFGKSPESPLMPLNPKSMAKRSFSCQDLGTPLQSLADSTCFGQIKEVNN